jgi:hypothetical protein
MSENLMQRIFTVVGSVAVVAVVAIFIWAGEMNGIGGYFLDYPPLSTTEVAQMNTSRQLTLAYCQQAKVIEDLGGAAGKKYLAKVYEKVEATEGNPPLQVVLGRDGYFCSPEELNRIRERH